MEEGYNGALGTYILKFVPESLPTNWTDFTGAYDLREKLSFRIRILNECMISFESNGGESIAPLTVLAGGTVTEPAAPEREDYQFEGWYKDADFAERYDFTEPVTDDITLYAKWVQNTETDHGGCAGSGIGTKGMIAPVSLLVAFTFIIFKKGKKA